MVTGIHFVEAYLLNPVRGDLLSAFLTAASLACMGSTRWASTSCMPWYAM